MQITVQKRREGKKFFFAYSPHFSFGGGGNWTEDDRRTEGIFLPLLPPFLPPPLFFSLGLFGKWCSCPPATGAVLRKYYSSPEWPLWGNEGGSM